MKRNQPLLLSLTGLMILSLAPVAQAQITLEQQSVKLLAQNPISVTGVQLDFTAQGLELILDTLTGRTPIIEETVEDNTLIFDLLNAQLENQEGFRQENPAAGIAAIEVVQQDASTIRVRVIGTQMQPRVEVMPSLEGVALNIQPAPAESVPPIAEEDEDIETIELIVTATRTAEEEEDIPRAVTVVTHEQIKEQSNLTTNLVDILGQTVPGLGPPTQTFDGFPQTLRGRNTQILIDGVPVSTNQNSAGATVLRSIAPSAIERIEVVRGPSAAFGEGATGGVINIITRQPGDEEINRVVEARVNSRGDFEEESFGTYFEVGQSERLDTVDYVFNLSWETFGYAFDAEGDRIPNVDIAAENGRVINLLGKAGVDLTEDQRLQVSVNYFNDTNRAEFLNDPTADEDPDADKARAIERDIEFIGLDDEGVRRYTNISLNYSHDNILNSQLRVQGFYRDNFNRGAAPFEFGGDALVFQQESERWGGRVELETDFSPTLNVLWGVDYSGENLSQPYQRIDAEEFINSNFTVARFVGDVFWTPPYEVENFGVFAQGQWDVNPRWLVSGGLRYENIGVSVDNYTAVLFRDDSIDVEH